MKVCSHCRQDLPLSEFYITKKKLKSGEIKKTPRYVCKACDRKAKRERDKRNPDRRANKHLINKYGITLKQKQQMIIDQGCKCKICPKPISPAEHSKSHVDHCHETGHIRGVLCHNCNRGIGYLQHNPAILVSASQYLVQSEQQRLFLQQQDQEESCGRFFHASPLSQDLHGSECQPRC